MLTIFRSTVLKLFLENAHLCYAHHLFSETQNVFVNLFNLVFNDSYPYNMCFICGWEYLKANVYKGKPRTFKEERN